MRNAGIVRSPVRQEVGWVAEKTAGLKLRVADLSDRGVRTFEMLEMIALGIDGKCALWAVLQSISTAVPILRGADYTRLSERASHQRDAIEARRLQWAATAFTAGAAYLFASRPIVERRNRPDCVPDVPSGR